MKVKDLHNEKDLLIKIAQGNQHAFRIIFDRYHNKVFGYSIKLLRSESAAEEVVQDVFLKIWVNRANISEIENFGGYLRTVARNHALNALKRIARETVAFALKNQDWTDADPGTENYIHYKDTQQILTRALDALPPQQKLVYSMCKVEGMKQDEVAQKLSISPLTVKAHLRQAAQSVKSFILMHTDVVSILILLAANNSGKK